MSNSSNADDGDGEKPLQSIIGGAKWVFGGRIAKMAIVFLAQIIVARILGASFYGGIAQANAIVGVAGLIGAFGIGSGVTRQLSYYEDEPERARGIIRAGLIIGIIGTTLVGLVLFITAQYIATEIFNDDNLIVLIQVAAFGVPLGFLGNLGVSMAKASRDASLHTYINQLLRPITNSAFRIGAAVFGFGAVGVITGSVIASAITAVVALVLAASTVPISLRGPAKSMYGSLFFFSLPLMFAGGFNFLIGDIDTFLIGALNTSAAVGLYTAVFNLRPMVLVFFFPATYLLGPVLTRLQKEERPTDAQRTYTAISKWTTLISFPLFLLPFLFPRVVLSVSYGSGYINSNTIFVLRLFAVSMLVNFALGANDRAVVALGHNRATMWIAAIAAGLNFVLNLVLIPIFGIIGAALASTIAFISRDVINTVLLYRVHGLFPLSKGIFRVFAVVTVLIPIGYLIFITMAPVRFLSVTVIGIIFLIIYIPLAIRLGVEKEMDYKLFREIEDSQGFDLSLLRRAIRWIKSMK